MYGGHEKNKTKNRNKGVGKKANRSKPTETLTQHMLATIIRVRTTISISEEK